jgi:hypothetical protein
MDEVAEVVGVGGVEKMSEVIESVPKADRQEFVGKALETACSRDPKAVAGYLAGDAIEKPGPQNGQDLIVRLGERLQESDSAYASKWMEEISADDRPLAMRGIATQMARSDVVGLSSMLSTMRRDTAWAEGVRVLAKALEASDREMADNWRTALKSAGYP